MARKFRELEAGMPAEAIAASDTIRARLKETALEERNWKRSPGEESIWLPGGD